MDNFKTIYRILKALEAAMDYEEADTETISAARLGISQTRWAALLKMLAAAGYIEGVQIYEPADGGLIVNAAHPHITLKGLEYVAENNLMQKAYRLMKGMRDVPP